MSSDRRREEGPVAEDEFFRQLAGGAPAAGHAAAATGQHESEPPSSSPPAATAGESRGPAAPLARNGSGRGGGARRLVAALALGAILAGLIAQSNGPELSARHPAEPAGQNGEPNGRPAAADARLRAWWPAVRGGHGRTLRVAWRPGGRAMVAGRLTSAGGEPVAGAQIRVLAADGSKPERGPRSVGAVQSDARGRFVAAIALDQGAPRKLLSFVYRAHRRDKLPAATGSARLELVAPLSVRTPTPRTRRGRSVPLAGRAPARAAVEVLMLQPGTRRWRTHSSVHATRTGRWEAGVYIPSYGPRGTLRLRARVPGDDRRGFLPTASHPVSVRVR